MHLSTLLGPAGVGKSSRSSLLKALDLYAAKEGGHRSRRARVERLLAELPERP